MRKIRNAGLFLKAYKYEKQIQIKLSGYPFALK